MKEYAKLNFKKKENSKKWASMPIKMAPNDFRCIYLDVNNVITFN